MKGPIHVVRMVIQYFVSNCYPLLRLSVVNSYNFTSHLLSALASLLPNVQAAQC